MDLLQFFLTGSSSAIKLQKLTGRHKIRVDKQQQQQESKQASKEASKFGDHLLLTYQYKHQTRSLSRCYQCSYWEPILQELPRWGTRWSWWLREERTSPIRLPPFFYFSFFSHLISPNTTGRQYVTSSCCCCCYYYCCSSFFFFKIKICCYKNPQQASKQQEKADETKHTHTHTHRRELERRQQQEFTAHTGGGGEAGRRDGRSWFRQYCSGRESDRIVQEEGNEGERE